MKEHPLTVNGCVLLAAVAGELATLSVPVQPTPQPGTHWRKGIFMPPDRVELPLHSNPVGDVGDRIWLREPWRMVGTPEPVSESQSLVLIHYQIDSKVVEYTVGAQYAARLFASRMNSHTAQSLPFGFSRAVLVIESVAALPASRRHYGTYQPFDWVFGVHSLGKLRIPHARVMAQ